MKEGRDGFWSEGESRRRRDRERRRTSRHEKAEREAGNSIKPSKVNPEGSAAEVRRGGHRTSKEKRGWVVERRGGGREQREVSSN